MPKIKTAARAVRMVSHGASCIGLGRKQEYWRHVPASAGQVAHENWKAVGGRLRDSMKKVVEQDFQVQ